MLNASSLSNDLWAEATASAVYLQNRTDSRANPGTTPYQLWHERKPSLSHLRLFGCIAYLHTRKEKRGKYDPESKCQFKCQFVGYCETQKGFRAWDPISRKVRIGRDIVFDECMPGADVVDPADMVDLSSRKNPKMVVKEGEGKQLPADRAPEFKENYSPVVRHESVRLILAWAASMDLDILQLDVKTVFLHGDLEEELHME